MKRRAVLLLTALGAALALAGVPFAIDDRPAHAATTFTVNSTADDFDGDTADGVCEAFVFGDPGRCTLRAAIEQANATAGADTIDFNIPDDPTLPGNEVKIIAPVAALAAITEQVTINGYTQLGASPNTKAVGNDAVLRIELSGANIASGASGLWITGSNSVVKGLVINDFSQNGVLLSGSGATGDRIEGNYIGTDATGTRDLGNGGYGVEVGQPDGNTIGGTSAGARNLISGNDAEGIFIGSSSNTVQGNYIGTEKDGNSALGNTGTGVVLQGPDNTIGGKILGAANTIAFNNGDGVKIDGNHIGNRILSNSIFSNTGLGTDLFPVGVTPNDPKDPDIGANNLQNYPVIARATRSHSTGRITIKGRLDSNPGRLFTV
jgi:CSLREA domain-containing protein